MQAVDRGLMDVLAQSAHWRQSEGNLIPVQDLQEANLQQQGRRGSTFTVASPRARGYAAWAPGGPQHLLPYAQCLLLSSCSRPFNSSFPLRLMAQAISVVQIYCLATNAVPVGQGPWELFGMKGHAQHLSQRLHRPQLYK